MLLQDRKYRTCKSCKARHQTSSEVYGCDACRKRIDMNKPKADYLRATVHYRESGKSDDIVCCSWPCMIEKLAEVKCDYFVSFPFLHFDAETPKGMRAQDFFKLIRPEYVHRSKP